VTRGAEVVIDGIEINELLVVVGFVVDNSNEKPVQLWLLVLVVQQMLPMLFPRDFRNYSLF
jgi:hypothetical protein